MKKRTVIILLMAVVLAALVMYLNSRTHFLGSDSGVDEK